MTVKEFKEWLDNYPGNMDIDDIGEVRIEFEEEYVREPITTGYENLETDKLKDLLNKELGMPLSDYEKLMEQEIRKRLEFV